ncbi:hypothetical protein MKZ38_007659 [Zalerion maritima]|uniref:Uncharacterized protein n=1 Tax=Zalerion maritima TaxID=339359 RepID=A0AAD5S0P0_9PEZI|nr:hypothetical protein MKZ38_007659 [Zalerion maritima]
MLEDQPLKDNSTIHCGPLSTDCRNPESFQKPLRVDPRDGPQHGSCSIGGLQAGTSTLNRNSTNIQVALSAQQGPLLQLPKSQEYTYMLENRGKSSRYRLSRTVHSSTNNLEFIVDIWSHQLPAAYKAENKKESVYLHHTDS